MCVCSLRYPTCNAHAPYCQSVACPALHFPTLSHKRNDFTKNVTKHKMCVLIFSTTFVWKIFYSTKNWARYDRTCILVIMWSTLYSCQILKKIGISQQFSEKILKCQILRKSGPVGAEMLHADRRTDMTKLIVAFHNFANAPKKPLHLHIAFDSTHTHLLLAN
jgi:hypothetical protein